MKGDPKKLLRVAKGFVVVFDYALYAEDGELVEETDGEDGAPVTCVYGYGTLLPGLERGLLGMAPAETREILVPPEDGYGPWDSSGEYWVDRAELPEGVEIDDEFEAEQDGEPIALRVVEVTDDAVLVDRNHPLAGETIRFDVIVREVRPPTDEELEAARASAPRVHLGFVSSPEPEPAQTKSTGKDDPAWGATPSALDRPRATTVEDDEQ